jgi:uncharacterized protein (DUF1330 family)
MEKFPSLRTRSLLFSLVMVCTVAATAHAAPKAYAIAEVNVTDPVIYQKYIAAVSPVVAHFGGKYLVRAGRVVPLEGKAPTGRFIVIEFPSLAVAEQFESSPEYRAVAPLRLRSARSRLFLVEGALP